MQDRREPPTVSETGEVDTEQSGHKGFESLHKWAYVAWSGKKPRLLPEALLKSFHFLLD